MQRWRKLGQVLQPDGTALERCMLPTPQRRDNGSLRLYFGAPDLEMVSRVSFVDVDPQAPTRAVTGTAAPVLDIGEPGHFDDNGVIPGALIERAADTLLFYVGFQRQSKIPYTMLTGLAISTDGGSTFHRAIETPILERSSQEPFFRTASHLLPAGEGWRMWYIGGGGWLEAGGRQLPTYSLRTMVSTSVMDWPSHGEVCLAPIGDEIGFGRPYVLHEGGLYRMWYSIRRRQGYRLGYAESADGVRWRRLDDRLDLGAPLPGFDDQMTCYSAVVRLDGRLLMFYNGNGYGRTGIGVAVLEDD